MNDEAYEKPRLVVTRVGAIEVPAPVAERVDELLSGVQSLTAAFHAAIRSPQGVVPAGYEDFYQPDFFTRGDKG